MQCDHRAVYLSNCILFCKYFSKLNYRLQQSVYEDVFLRCGLMARQHSSPAEEPLGRRVDDPEEWVVGCGRCVHLAQVPAFPKARKNMIFVATQDAEVVIIVSEQFSSLYYGYYTKRLNEQYSYMRA